MDVDADALKIFTALFGVVVMKYRVKEKFFSGLFMALVFKYL